MFPVLVASGVKKKTAACTVILGGAYDLGPSCPITTWVMSQEGFAEHSSVAAFFAKYQIPVTLLVMAVTIILFLVVNIKADRKEAENDEKFSWKIRLHLECQNFMQYCPWCLLFS